MAKLRTQSGRVLTRNNVVTCQCCTLFALNVNLGEIGECACDNEEARCFGDAFPAPEPWDVEEYGYAKNAPLSRTFRLQGEIQSGPFGQIVGWRNLVSSPTAVTLTGDVGGEIAIFSYRSEYSPQPAANEAVVFSELVDLGGFDCGLCPIPAPEPAGCEFSLSWVMYPNMAYQVQLISSYYLQKENANVPCVPWIRAILAAGGAAPP